MNGQRLIPGFGLLAVGLALGGVAIWVEAAGLQHRALVGIVLLAGGIALGALPLRYALPAAIVVGAYQGLIDNFIGSPGRYWKEAFVCVLIVRALRARLPTLVESAVAALIGAAFLCYSVGGAGPSELAWGVKLLILYVAAGWAITVLARDDEAWPRVLDALAVVTASSVVLGYWQHTKGTQGMLALGFPYGESVRDAAGRLRVFAGFSYAAPFSYVLAIAFLAWFSALLGGARTRAIATAWVPPLVFFGLYLSLNRIALVGVAASVIAVLVWTRKFHFAVPLAAIVVGAIVLFAHTTSGSFLAQGFTFGSDSAQARQTIWEQRWNGLDAFGHGPSSAGAALARVGSAAPAAMTGVVDNQYLSWLYEYGILGGAMLCALFATALLAPFRLRFDQLIVPLEMRITAALVGVFLVVAALSVNVWEEFPLNFIASVILGLLLRGSRIPAVHTTQRASVPRLHAADVVGR